MRNYFEGWYFKHQKDGNTIALIPGRSNDTAFIQVITKNNSYNINFPLSEYRKSNEIHVGKNVFSKNGIDVNIHTSEIDLEGRLIYGGLTPLYSDIMGPFRFLPMQCRHGVISMRHHISGSLTLNGHSIDFSNGVGYIEKDSGNSFPKSYIWLQCNDLSGNDSIMASIAQIPMLGLWFWGCICVVYCNGKEYRLATYKAVKIHCRSKNRIELSQGKYHLKVSISDCGGNNLYAPHNGKMNRIIRESAAVKAHFRFSENGNILLDRESDNASFESV